MTLTLNDLCCSQTLKLNLKFTLLNMVRHVHCRFLISKRKAKSVLKIVYSCSSKGLVQLSGSKNAKSDHQYWNESSYIHPTFWKTSDMAVTPSHRTVISRNTPAV